MYRKGFVAFALLCLMTLSVAHAAGPPTLRVATTESMSYLLSFWLIELKRNRGDFPSRVVGTDADGVPVLLANGEATVGAMTRLLTKAERAMLESKYGAPPIELVVAQDALAVYVHRDNPVTGISLPRLDALFSTERRCGYAENVFWWDQLGVDEGEWKIRQVELFGPGPRSGLRAVFADLALCGGTHKATLEMRSSAPDLLYTVSNNRAAIAYGSLSEARPEVRAVPLARREGEASVAPSAENVANETYPLKRNLFLYALPTRRQVDNEFLVLALSDRGQHLAGVNKFVPLSMRALEAERAKLR